MTSQRSRDRLVDQLRDMGIQSELVLDAIKNTPRHLFVDEALASRAYDNIPLPIGYNQTISQPYVVARMTEALLRKGEGLGQTSKLDKALEIGTGCGYQTTILSQFARKVYSVERIEALLNEAKERFDKLQYGNIEVKHGDGKHGWPENGPYDGILAAAASTGVPQDLLEQLAPEGRLVIPVGRSGAQKLLLITRGAEGFIEKRLDGVNFVPMLGGTS